MSHSNTKPEFSRDLGRLMLMMRRLVKEEFTATVHIDEADAVEELLAFAERSRNTLLRQMARELESLLNVPVSHETQKADEAPATTAGGNYYRGAVVPERQPVPSGPGEAPREGKKLVYRGQVIR